MNSNDSTEQIEPQKKTIDFPGKDHLTKAVVDGSLRYFIGEFGVFVMFMLSEQNGSFSVCYARGETDQDPMGESFIRWMTLATIEDANVAFEKFESLTLTYLKPVSSETNT